MTDKTEENDMGRKKQISDQKRLHRERMRLQKGVFSSLANAVGNIGDLYADFVQSDEVRNSMKATADKAIECMDNIKELNELEERPMRILHRQMRIKAQLRSTMWNRRSWST